MAELLHTEVPRPPESMRPDRPEVMNEVGARPAVEIAPGVTFDCLVGARNRARGLCTGLVTFEPGTVLPCHAHDFGESTTLLEGEAAVAVEGRVYRLGPMDNITIPRGLAHRVAVGAAAPRTIMHVGLASSEPTSRPASGPVEEIAMSDDRRGFPFREQVIRFPYARRYEAGPGATLVDYCSSDMIPGFDMSGGYGSFGVGGRLPAHVHDFDESITIVEGVATCVVEGRRYRQSDCSTALQPRGRVHYFINEAPQRMAMIWYYAGPLPRRLIVDEDCATVEGDPWK